jgi:hypothetical protein
MAGNTLGARATRAMPRHTPATPLGTLCLRFRATPETDGLPTRTRDTQPSAHRAATWGTLRQHGATQQHGRRPGNAVMPRQHPRCPAAGRDASNTPTAQAAGATPGNTRAARKRDTAWATLSILDDIMPARHRHTQRPALTGPGTCCAKRAVAARRTDARSITRGAALHALPGCSEDWLGAADHVRRPSTRQAHSRHKPHADSASAPSGGCRGALNLARAEPCTRWTFVAPTRAAYMRCTAGGLQLHGSMPHGPFGFPARHWRLAARPALASPHPARRAARALDSQHAGRQAMRGVRSLALAGTTPRVALHCLEALGRAWTPAELPAWRWSVGGVWCWSVGEVVRAAPDVLARCPSAC